MIAYQLQDETTGWTGYWIWRNKEIAQSLAEQMNQDREKYNLKPTITLKIVEIVEPPF